MVGRRIVNKKNRGMEGEEEKRLTTIQTTVQKKSQVKTQNETVLDNSRTLLFFCTHF